MMNVTMGARCWNGERRRTIMCRESEVSVMREEENLKRGARHFDLRLRSFIAYGLPIALLAHGLPGMDLASAFAIPPVPVATVGEISTTMAVPTSAKTQVLHAFDPLIDLVQALAYPIAGVMIAAGCLFLMVGQKEKGMSMLQNAALGYILVQLSPMLLKILVGLGSGI